MKKILVTGGAGFIGSHICGQLLEKGHRVLCLDNMSTGSVENIRSLQSYPLFSLLDADTRTMGVSDITSLGGVDEIYDLASPASVTYVSEHPIEAATVNSIGTKNLLDIALSNRAKFLFASSSEVYGDPKEHPQKETYWGNVNCIGVRSGYDEGKRFGEAITMAYHREHGVDTRIARIFNTYGPNSHPQDSRVVPRFITQALAEGPLTVHGDGLQTRSFCYVSDLVSGLIKLMESDETNPVNLGNPDEYKIIDVAKRIIALTNSKSSITFVARPADDPSVRRPDIARVRQTLDWQPEVSLEDGLKKTIAYFRNRL